ncbi:UbiA prenyltransferase family [Xylariaceae sp. FL1651]|nr:UbiA prenyltransferase family [Xylariaceae sp. FL1651]
MPLSYFKAIWLFTYSDIKTIVVPQSTFGIAAAFAACTLQQTPVEYSIFDWLMVHYPLALTWTWLNLLPFNIFNQLSDAAIAEDYANKAWRPLPARIISQKQAMFLMGVSYVLAVITAWYIGGFRQSGLLIALGIWYNALGGADGNFIIRNIINALGILSFASGAMEVALGTRLLMATRSMQWIAILILVILTTIQVQDLGDVEGDVERGRRTMPIVIGDKPTRWLTALFVFASSVLCPVHWSISWHILVLYLLLGVYVSHRVLMHRSVEADKFTFKFWNVWYLALDCL